jgi:glutaminyl-peptide cyclotransferase
VSRLAAAAALASLGAIAIASSASGGSHPPYVRTAKSDFGHFDSHYAWRLVREQVAVGQRPAGSRRLRRLANELLPLLPNAHFEPIPHQHGLRNIVGTIAGRRPGILIGAHYDTLTTPKGFVGANNGAAGTAVVVEVARALAASNLAPGGREIRFVLFDGEEPPSGLPEQSGDFYHSGLRGSRAYVARHPHRTEAMILLDYVGNKHLQLPREGSSDPSLWHKLRNSAKAVGVARFFPRGTEVTITDDHTPFLRAGVPAIDLIDWRYPGHDLRDRLRRLSRKSLGAVGRTVMELIARLR